MAGYVTGLFTTGASAGTVHKNKAEALAYEEERHH